MAKKKRVPAGPRNRFLAYLPEATYRRLEPVLELVSLTSGQILYEARAPIEYAYFPMGAVLSALTVMEDGNAIEVATIGNEGMVGHYGFGGMRSPHRMIVQVENGGLRIQTRVLEREAASDDRLRELWTEYHVAFVSQVSQSVACNGLHRLAQRCCRWLLMTRDRVGADELRLTHEYLALMLGARRASVTDILRPLQKAGLVRSHRGWITILDRAGLEARSCECYFVVRDEYDRLLGELSQGETGSRAKGV
jgi:CRP-like cAMP-binding protein